MAPNTTDQTLFTLSVPVAVVAAGNGRDCVKSV